MEQPPTHSTVNEHWFLAARGTTPEGVPFVLVSRVKDGDTGTSWRLEVTTNRNGRTDWRCIGHTNAQGVMTTYAPRNLSHSLIDTALRNFCQPGEWVGTQWVAA